jgi:hypothetical protein
MYLLSSGYKLAYCVKSVVHHYGSGSFGKNPSDFKLFYGNRNQIVNFFLFYSWQTTLKLLPLFLLVQLGHLFVNAPLKRLKAKCKARIWILKHQKAIKSLRIQVQKDKKLTDKELLAQLSKDFTQSLYLPSISKTKGVLTVMNKFFNWYCNIIL